jgi:methionyl-tRNA synthetase
MLLKNRAVYRLASRTYSSSHLITTPIFYVNADPHVGHLYTAVLADAWTRFKRLQGCHDVVFTTGTDEHGLKIQQSAERAGVEVGVFCDQVSAKFRHLFKQFNVQYSDFVRTTDERHKDCVGLFWNMLNESGLITKDVYEGWYSRRLARNTDGTIDYRFDNRRFWLSAHDCQVPTPTSRNLELEQQIRIFEAD